VKVADKICRRWPNRCCWPAALPASASIGLAMYPQGEVMDDLMRHADQRHVCQQGAAQGGAGAARPCLNAD
jgi:hypothetical protein